MPETIPVIPIPTRPPAPTGLRLTDASISTFSFDWDQYTDNADLLVLTIQKGEEPEELVTDSISISSTSEFISGLEDNTTYTVRLYAEKEYRGGLRVRSLPDLQEATTQTYEPPPERVTGFGHVAVTYYTVLLHWDEPVINDGDIYNIYYATQRYGAQSLIASELASDSIQYKVYELSPETTYYFFIERKNSENKASAKVMTTVTTPAVPGTLSLLETVYVSSDGFKRRPTKIQNNRPKLLIRLF